MMVACVDGKKNGACRGVFYSGQSGSFAMSEADVEMISLGERPLHWCSSGAVVVGAITASPFRKAGAKRNQDVGT